MKATVKRIAAAAILAAVAFGATGCKDLETGTTDTTRNTKPVIDMTDAYDRIPKTVEHKLENTDIYDGIPRESAEGVERLDLDRAAERLENDGYKVITPDDLPEVDINGDGK